MRFCNIFNFFRKHKYKNINIKSLPSQGYFYPKNLKILIYAGNSDDHSYFLKNLLNSNIFGIIEIVKKILKKKIKISPKNFNFNELKAIDIFYIFIEFIKITTNETVYFGGIEFKSENFMYFNFEDYSEHYDPIKREYVFEGWKFSLPSIGIESSLNKFSHEITIRGELQKYQNSNLNLIYFLGKETELNYQGMINIINIMEELSAEDEEYINSIVKKFNNANVYILVTEGRDPVKISPTMIKEVWNK